ncbi:MFS transporter [Jannaschia sp. LMIT008]|uniref:MFS transporter n=1 Tax=Jannaschia maritima TaxID=3032585 RepID=UPI002811B5DC|nr:MFS transporter [Jannaschia sp. LMIT008]
MTTPAPAVPRGLIPLLSAANFAIGMGAFLVIGALTPIAGGLSLSPEGAGWILTVYALSYAVLSPLLVASTGRIGRRTVLVAGLGTFAIAAVASALAPSLAALLGARVLAAAGAGLTTPVGAAIAAALAPPEARGRTLALVFLGLTVAQVVGVPFGSWVAYTFGWRAAFWIVAVLAGACALAAWRIVPAGLRFQPVRMADLGAVLADRRLVFAILFTATYLAAIYVPFTYLAPLLEATVGLGRDGVTAMLVVAGLGAVAGNLAGGALADRLGPVQTLILLAAAQVAAMPMLSSLPLPLGWVALLILGWNAAGYAFNSGQQVRIVGLAGPRAPVALSLHAASIYLGAAIGAAAGGWVIAGYGLRGLGVAGGLAAVLALAHIVASHRLDGRSVRP